MALQHLRSSTAHKRPVPGNMSDGQLGINTNLASPGLFFKDTNGDLVKVGPVHVGTTAPNASPASGGTAGNSVGEQWLDTTGGTYVFKVWDGSAWRSETGTFVDVNGDVMTGALGIIAGSAATPGLYISGDTNTGLYSPGADQVAISTGGSGKLFVNNAGEVDVSSANARLYITTTGTNTAVATLRNASYYYNINLDGANGGLTFYNGTERLRITAAGLVGIGTSSVNKRLEIAGNNDAVTENNTLRFTDTDVSTEADQQIGKIEFYSSDASTPGAGVKAYIGAFAADTTPDAYLAFATQDGSTVSTPVERVRITSDGKVGIGTTNVNAKLEISGNSGGRGLRLSEPSGEELDISAGANPNDPARIATGLGSGIAFAVNGNSGQNVSIDSSGRLLVGTSTLRAVEPNGGSTSGATLTTHFEGISSLPASVGLIHNGTIAAEGSALYLARTRGTAVASSTPVALGDTLGTIAFAGGDGTDVRTKAAEIYAVVDGTPGANSMPGRIVLSTTAAGASSPTEHVRITSAGNTLFGTTSTSIGTTNFGTRFYGTEAPGRIATSRNVDGTGSVLQVYGNAGEFRVVGNGNVLNTNNSYGAISDIKLKENIVDANSQWSDIKALQVRKYNFKEGQTHTQIGLVAQEVELVSPGLVSESPDRDAEGNDLGTVTKSVNYSVLYMKAVKALQEAMGRIETLEAKVAALESA